jgi:hypothetical protein
MKGYRRLQVDWQSAIRNRQSAIGLGFRLGFAQAGNAIAFFPLTPFLEQLRPLKSFKNVPFAAQGGRRAQASML